MSESESASPAPPFVESVLHPSDFSRPSESAFAHALAIALLRQTDFTILHVRREALGEEEWAKFPAVRATLGDGPVEIFLLHVGDGGKAPTVALPEDPACAWNTLQRGGDVVEETPHAVKERDVDLIVMATAGREGILDALRGSVTEQVLRRAPCPVLAVPAD
jgi:nucleotide-binding universal stress UspA family protein